MVYYTWFNGQGRAALADECGVEDPLTCRRITAPQPALLPTLGRITELKREGLSYIVSVSRDAQEIDVQERRDDVYDPVE